MGIEEKLIRPLQMKLYSFPSTALHPATVIVMVIIMLVIIVTMLVIIV